MNGPGVFGDHMPPQTMPPGLYRAMILQGVVMGATVYSFEPYWDLFDQSNNRCWNEVILPTLREVVHRRLIPNRDQVLSKTGIAYHVAPARDVNEFHRNLRDLDWLSDDGLLAKAAYGVWEPMLEFELIPNRGHWFIPLLPSDTPQPVLDRFPFIVQPGQCDSVEAWESLLKQHHFDTGHSETAWTCSINGCTYVMQTHENLYERQPYSVRLPKPVRGITAKREGDRMRLEWPGDPGARKYFIHRVDNPLGAEVPTGMHPIAESTQPSVTLDRSLPCAYTVTADTATMEVRDGTVNFLDCLVFPDSVSAPAEYVHVDASGNVQSKAVREREDVRPASQVVYPTFEGVPAELKPVADEVVSRINAFKQAYEAMDWRAVTEFYSPRYEDPNGFHREYVGRAWKWWFRRNNKTFMLRQIRHWDFSEYAASHTVRVKMFHLCTAVRRDDQPFGYDGLVRFPRHRGAEVTYTWACEDGVWRIVRSDPAVPNLEEILWNSRPMDKAEKLVPGVDE